MSQGDIAPSPEQLDAWVATARFAPFLAASADDHAAAMQLYVWNARLASAFFEVIHHVEVLVRNAMHRELKAAEPVGSLRSWLIDPKVLAKGDLAVVERTITRLKERGKPITDNRVVATLGFGFWTGLIGKQYDELWKATLHRAFPNTGLRRDVAGPLNRIWQLRNSVAHHEAIFDLPLANRYRDTIGLAEAIDPSAAAWIAGISQLPEVLARRPTAETADAAPA
jgi:hypothetical protein